jgi:hypothetical protein
MRDVVDKVVKPETQSKGAGWALLHNRDDPKTAKHMISHAWDEDFEEFVGALKKERDIGNISGPVWICAFGLYQGGDSPTIGDQLGLDVKLGPFSRILQSKWVRGEGSMVAVFTSTCSLYTRMWCVFELFEAVENDVKICIASCQKVVRADVPSVENACCGNPNTQHMNNDERMIRRMILSSAGGFTRVQTHIEEIAFSDEAANCSFCTAM